ncbi:PKD domain-containing protein, partial [Aestuariibaculum marinum]|uniref:PKD domain-containing protein n=1 Tax=Aestuariibaculum marinum TaxID=2683592 RepID=UPI001886F052
MKTSTFKSLKKYFILILFLCIGILEARADCTIPVGTTTIANLNTNCSGNQTGILYIPDGATLDLNSNTVFPAGFSEIIVLNGGTLRISTDYIFPSTLLKITLVDSDFNGTTAGPLLSGRIHFAQNYFLTLSTATQLDIQNIITPVNDTGSAIFANVTSQATRIYIGSQPYAAAQNPNGAGVCFTFNQVIQNGGTPKLDGEVSIGGISGSTNSVCFNNQPFTLTASISGNIPFSTPASFSWSKISGPGIATFGNNISSSPQNTTENETSVTLPGIYVFRVTVIQNLSVSGCDVNASVTLTKDITITIVASPVANFNASSNQACFSMTFDGLPSLDYNPPTNLTYEWDFNYDGSNFDVTASGVNPTHIFPGCGTYTVALRVTDPDALTACNSSITTQTFDITIPAFSISENDGAQTVSCLSDATEPTTLPNITDSCGNTITPSAPVITDSPDPLTCEGTRTYTYTYTDCAGNQDSWSYTYTIDYSGGLTAPANDGNTVSCPADAVNPGAPATIQDACGRDVIPVLIGQDDPSPDCEGTVVWRYRYTACDGETTADWTYTYTIDYSGGLTAP